MNHSELLELRLRNQLISAHAPLSPGEVVRQLGAMQAQDLLGAKWALALRSGPDVSDADVEQAIAEKQLVRSWPMRGTLHFAPPEDLRWMQSVTSKKLIDSAAGRREQLGLTDEQLSRAAEAAAEGLGGGRALERREMLALFEAAGVSTARQRGYHLLWHLSQQGLLCFGPMQGKQPTFVLLDEWLPPTGPIGREEAVALFAKRYFTGHGPATLKDFARWTGLSMAEARAGLAAVTGDFECVSVDGVEYWVVSSAADSAAGWTEAGRTLYLLPGFDEYVVGYGDRQQMFGGFHDDYHSQVAANGMFAPVVVADGQVIGTWKRAVKARDVVVTPALFRKLDRAERVMLAEQVERYGIYLGKPARLAD